MYVPCLTVIIFPWGSPGYLFSNKPFSLIHSPPTTTSTPCSSPPHNHHPHTERLLEITAAKCSLLALLASIGTTPGNQVEFLEKMNNVICRMTLNVRMLRFLLKCLFLTGCILCIYIKFISIGKKPNWMRMWEERRVVFTILEAGNSVFLITELSSASRPMTTP